MNAVQVVRTALKALTVNKMRSALTMLGVIIGVAAVISLMSFGEGTQAAITSNIESLGTDLLFVSPGAASQSGIRGAQGSATTLTLEDAEALLDTALAPSVLTVAPEAQVSAQVVAGVKNTYSQIAGVTPEYEHVRNVALAEGQFISSYDLERRFMVAVLGSNVAETLFDDISPVGQTIKIDGRRFEVVGVLESKGGAGFGSQDYMIFAPITTVQYRLSSARTASGEMTVSTINVQVVRTEETDAAIEQITAILRERHEITGEDDFTITSMQETIEAVEETTDTMVFFLGAVAGISLLVGGIGVMNIMLVSVTERTREIGIRKAVGARRRDILLQFLVESASISLIGGGIGVLTGFGISQLMSGVSMGGGMAVQAVLSLDIIILAVSVAAGVGIVFGLYPAYRAARLNPIDALGYE
ncbi:MAG: ABC transporter permease [Chloroflexota bacterium]|nr:ABC transporter permease [Chloroflexota bacterium]